MRDSLRMVVVLTIIAMVSAGVLSQVYNVTSVIIAENQAREMESAVYRVLSGVETVNFIDAPFVLFAAKDSEGTPVGFAYAASASGYSGAVRVMVGVKLPEKTIENVVVLEHTETPGLGSRIEEEGFRRQFAGKDVDSQLRVGSDIDNITGATMSAVAVTEAVRSNFAAAIAAYERGQ